MKAKRSTPRKPLNIKVVVGPTPYDPRRIEDIFTVMKAVGRWPIKPKKDA